MKTKKWIVQFRRPLMRGVPTYAIPKDYLRWRPADGVWMGHGKVQYWTGKSWTMRYERAKRYKTRDTAEKRGFLLVMKEHSLIGELEVAEFIPISKPKR